MKSRTMLQTQFNVGTARKWAISLITAEVTSQCVSDAAPGATEKGTTVVVEEEYAVQTVVRATQLLIEDA